MNALGPLFDANAETDRKPMNSITQILSKLESGDPSASEQLLPLIYDELRKLAAVKMAHEKPGQTLQATALVHDAYLRLVGNASQQRWETRGHFFAAAAEAMRRILVENARRKKRLRHGGDRNRVSLDDLAGNSRIEPDVILSIDESLTELAKEDADAAAVVKLHFFAGLTLDETADSLGISRATAYRQWAYARSWLKLRLADHSGPESSAEKK